MFFHRTFLKFGSASLRGSVQIHSNFVTKCVVHLQLILVPCLFLYVITTASIRKWMHSSTAASRQEVTEKHNSTRASFSRWSMGLAGRGISAQLPFSISHGEGLSSNFVKMHKLSFLVFAVPGMSASVEIYQ